MTQTDLNLNGLWWFFKPDGFEKFEHSKSAQAYELLSRHQHWLPVTSNVGDGCFEWDWDHSQTAPRMTWEQMPLDAKVMFNRTYRYALRRMGFGEIAWITAVNPEHLSRRLKAKAKNEPHILGAITFCGLDGWPSIETAVRQQLSYATFKAKEEKKMVEDGKLKEADRVYACFEKLAYGRRDWKSRAARDSWVQRGKVFKLAQKESLKLPYMVRIEVDWRYLIDREMTVDDVIAPLRTFYDRDPLWRSMLKLLQKRRSTQPKALRASRIALTCAILDCQRASVREFQGIIAPHLPIIGEEMPDANRVKDLKRDWREQCARAGFAKPPRNARVAKTIPGTFGLTNTRLVDPAQKRPMLAIQQTAI